jgi:hypothetical protein
MPRSIGSQRRWRGRCEPQTWIEFTLFPAKSKKSAFQINGITAGEKILRTPVCPHPRPLAHNLLTVLAGPGAHRVSGRMAVTSRHGIGTHGSEGVRRAGIPKAKRRCFVNGRRIIRASLSMECTWSGARDRPTVATDTGRAGMGVPVLVLRIRAALSCPPVFPTFPTMARAETQRGEGEVYASHFSPCRGRRCLNKVKADEGCWEKRRGENGLKQYRSAANHRD